MRVRGLKSFSIVGRDINTFVAPRAGAWIEIKVILLGILLFSVAPRAGAWIEISASA